MLSKLQKEEIKKLYEQGLKDPEIAKQVGLTYGQVNWFRKSNNMPANLSKKAKIQGQKILHLYRMGVSIPAIIKRTGIKYWSLKKFLTDNGITNCRRSHTFQPNIGPRELSIIIGTMLGDGTMYKDTAGNVRMIVRHCLQQKEYCFYLYNVLRHLKPTIKRVKIKGHIINGKTIHPSVQIEVRISLGKKLVPIYNSFYKDGKKIIPWNLMNQYTKEALAVHFMDDGSKKETNKQLSNFIFSTNCFTEQEVNYLSKFFLGRFGLNCSVVHCGGKPELMIKKDSVQRFIEIVKPYIIETFNYKICPSKTPLNGETPKKDNPVLNPQEIEENA